jgi:hypothetical protein
MQDARFSMRHFNHTSGGYTHELGPLIDFRIWIDVQKN